MEFTNEIIILIAVIYAIVLFLNIILFFKIWGMTNRVTEIKDLLKEWLDIEHPVIEDPKEKK